ncbi:alpha/beta hydrolase [Rhodophyticola porphyridii]|uniref:Alpha/beta hydrolase n=1 Tax=Rhodophyticola porphyridii TaxID=1852017 RepID=A0A3L9Y5Q1_9RHOB|nr:alpha/beta hydrolase [Rhodophyticola porphyridii]RMA42367.1 alpha/beta hydrolase [Rhodophyticola porphyridii]
MSDPSPQEVHRRRVMYIPGYDPVPPRKYRERYRREAAEQAAVSGYEIALGPKRTDGRFGWHVQAVMERQTVETDVEVMYWSDIVRASMKQGILATYGQLVRTAWIYIGSGALFRLMRLRKGPVIAALYPVVFLLAQLLLALGVGLAIALTVEWLGVRALGIPLSFFGLVVGLVMVWAVLDLFRRQDGRFLAYYLMHDYAFSARYGGAYPPAQEARMAEFADRIERALREDLDEVLIVGHSSGAYIAVSILADLIRAGRLPDQGPRLALLSLGQVIPMVSFLPKAHRLRADLAFLSARAEITWVDVTAPGDGCAFALCDPVAVTGVAPAEKRWPLVISAAFTQTLSPARWKALRWRLFELHFQYLNAFDRPRDYDYFRITAGPRSLHSRFAGRAPSRSRIERAVNRFTSVAA